MTSLVSVTNMTISNGGRTAVAASAAFALCRTDVPLVGNVYLECRIDAVAGGGGPGLLNTSEASYIRGTVNSFGPNEAGDVQSNGYSYLTNFQGTAALVAGDIIRLAYNSALGAGLGKWWISRNAEVWNNFYATPDPATGVSGFDPASGGGPWYFGHSCSGLGYQVTFNFGSAPFTYAIPSGYTPVDYPMPQGAM